MIAGELYDPLDADLVAAETAPATSARRSMPLARRNAMSAAESSATCSAKAAIPSGCSRRSSATTVSNIELGERVFFNFNCVVLDVCRVRIGDFTLFGPAVQIYTPMHPLNADLRRTQEFGKPIDIGSDVWVGGGAMILPRRDDRLARGDRRGQRRHARRPRRRVCRG